MRLKKTPGQLSLILAFVFGSMATAMAYEYTLRITNLMDEELLAPILVTSVRMDKHIFNDGYVTPEAQEQILTGDPGMLVKRIGRKAHVVHGSDGPPGVLLAPGKSVEITVEGRRHGGMRVIAMVAPTMKPDHFVTAVVNAQTMLPVTMERYDIGYDEGRKITQYVGGNAARIEVIRITED